MLLCVACGIWIAVSYYRASAAQRTFTKNHGLIAKALPIASEIMERKGEAVRSLAPLTENELQDLVDGALQSTGLNWISINPLAPMRVEGGENLERYTRTVQIDENDIGTIVRFFASIKQQRPDVSVIRITLTSRSKRIWRGSFDIQVVGRKG